MNGTSDTLAPRANADFVGHPEAERTLLRGWQSDRMHHAWLITGPRGVGKATLAFRFARFALNQEKDQGLFGGPPTLAVSPASPAFRQVAGGGHPDLLTIERVYSEKLKRVQAEIVVDTVRELGAFLHLKAAAGGWRVVVVDCADELNPNAANALLKLLEEPPAKALLLLVSHAPGRLLPTIRSRCRRLALGPLDERIMQDLLAKHSPQLADADRRLLIRLSEGSIGRALDIVAAGGVDLYRDIAGQLRQLPRVDAIALHALGDRLAQKDAADLFRLATEILLAWLGRMVRAAATGQGPAKGINDESAPPGLPIGRHSLERWLDLWEKTTRLFARAEDVNLDRKQVWVGAMLDIAGLASR